MNQKLNEIVKECRKLSGLTQSQLAKLAGVGKTVVYDIEHGKEKILREGNVALAVRASCAIPGLFPPVRLGDREYVDGGVTDNCSLATAAKLNPAHIIAIDLTANEATPGTRRLGDVFDRVVSAALHARVVADFDRFSSRVPVTTCQGVGNIALWVMITISHQTATRIASSARYWGNA